MIKEQIKLQNKILETKTEWKEVGELLLKAKNLRLRGKNSTARIKDKIEKVIKQKTKKRNCLQAKLLDLTSKLQEIDSKTKKGAKRRFVELVEQKDLEKNKKIAAEEKRLNAELEKMESEVSNRKDGLSSYKIFFENWTSENDEQSEATMLKEKIEEQKQLTEESQKFINKIEQEEEYGEEDEDGFFVIETSFIPTQTPEPKKTNWFSSTFSKFFAKNQ